MPSRLRSLLALAALVLVPEIAQAATAIATTNVNLRAGPSTRYPAVNVVQGGEDVHVFGCLANRSWCDVDFYGQRGWMSSDYLAFVRGGRRYTGPDVVGYIGAPVVTYSFGRYWDDHYRGRDFYRDRRRWDGIYGPPIFDRGPPPRARDRIGPPPPYPVRGEYRGYDGRDRFERERDRFEGRRDRFEGRRDRERFEDDRRFEDRPPPPWERDRGPGRPDWDDGDDFE